jgi:hypothetical protein
MIRTAIPFGYLFIAMFLFAAFLLGVGLFIWGWWRRSRIAGVLGGGMVFGVIALIAVNVWYGSALEWNPTIENDAVIVGTWTDHAQTITLAANKTFSYRTSSQLTSGTWARNDDDLNLRGDNYSATMRFVQFRGVYRLMTNPPGDPDAWDGDLGLWQAHP